VRANLLHIVFGNSEYHGDRLQLSDHHERTLGLHHIAGIDHAQAQHAGYRRHDLRIGQLKSCAIHLGLIGRNPAFQLGEPAAGKLRLVLLDLPFGLLDQQLVGLRVDGCQ
jgi:hypothetical protein